MRMINFANRNFNDNIGSYKIIEANGGQLENKVENEDCGEKFLTRRYWIKK